MDLRCFIAIELTEEVRKNIDSCIDKLRATGADVKWIASKNLHFTLKFLGSTPEDLIAGISRRLSEIAGMHDRFDIRIFGTGAFPNVKHPRVIWLGVMDSDEIIRLQREIDEAMREFGYEMEERDYRPHLTIGRVRSIKNRDALMKELATLKEADFGKIEVKNIILMKSELKRIGAEYSRLSEVSIGKGN